MLHSVNPKPTKDEEILALKAALKYAEFSGTGTEKCCPYCGGCLYHVTGCAISAMLREEAADAHLKGTGGTVVNYWLWNVNNDPSYAFLKPVPTEMKYNYRFQVDGIVRHEFGAPAAKALNTAEARLLCFEKFRELFGHIEYSRMVIVQIDGPFAVPPVDGS